MVVGGYTAGIIVDLRRGFVECHSQPTSMARVNLQSMN